MNPRSRPVLTALLLAVAACAGTDANKSGADVTDLTAAEYALPPSASVQVTPGTSQLVVGKTVKLATSIVNADGSPMPS